MRKLFVLLWITAMLSASAGPSLAAGDRAMKQRLKNELVEFTPPDAFLDANFVADEVDPGFIFGRIGDFAKSRSCPTAWLIGKDEKKRTESHDPQAGPVEYSLYLEVDCPGKLTYFVFVDRSQAGSAQWMEQQKQLHKSKLEPRSGQAETGLEEAARNGFPVNAELRFVEIEGELLLRPEDALTGEFNFQPIYDIRLNKAVER